MSSVLLLMLRCLGVGFKFVNEGHQSSARLANAAGSWALHVMTATFTPQATQCVASSGPPLHSHGIRELHINKLSN